MEQGARELAYQVLTAVDERSAYANLQLAHSLTADLSKAERSLTTQLVLGVLQWRNKLDFAVDRYLERPGQVPPAGRRLLRLGAYQLLELSRIPRPIACHETVELSKKVGEKRLSGMINGVLRRLAAEADQVAWPTWEADPVRYLEIMTSHPRWLVRRWCKQYGSAQARELCTVNNQPAGVSLRVNRLRGTRDDLLKQLEASGIAAAPSALSTDGIRVTAASAVTALPGFNEGVFSVQDESSMIVAPVVEAQPGEKILDTCAAPGGKTTHIAESTGDQATIMAWDIHPHKLRLIRQNCHRLGIKSIRTDHVDATQPLPDGWQEQADRVLVDAPCSGLGVLRRKPELRYRVTEADIQRLAALQGQILDQAALAVKPGGVLVYSTCTTEPEENFLQVKMFLQRHPDFYGEDLTPYLPALDYSAEEKRQIARGYWQILPHRWPGDGFFIARMRRHSKGE
ncbi:16S rRNA (cytosine(967)-C(5))-methyltransferase RsmB [Heliophilum fasciatum]|uniref:16S rRNA (cytosine(967)-C(5))-methyltransferase n=1 Tax=Heliophilum fasciatum TaxID=35700 RepID=A0A4R2RYK7_9FIRM|nr:16S rRNA (cytosine(967)-C(5))-methyltransferase RsmB [Heliophilum fasciatum]MCW2277206.1 16S rRNA (cytosine967-C5)-methyltransferase [Heliophilum fasciatum]TCP68159.1 16S rRNA (cytosine967-C5)-methyltransferase [Heliophilum fasciatum]